MKLNEKNFAGNNTRDKEIDSTNNKLNPTLDYYNQNAKKYSEKTFSIDMEEIRNSFLKYLKYGDHILDLGCGSGRDSKVFIGKGYKVTAIDGSFELCQIAKENIGQNVICMDFYDLDEVNEFDAIWACASLLHAPSNKLQTIFTKISISLKSDGYLYTSFKYGDFEGQIDGRYFKYFNEDSFRVFMKDNDSLELIETWVTDDRKTCIGTEKWLNLIIKKRIKDYEK